MYTAQVLLHQLHELPNEMFSFLSKSAISPRRDYSSIDFLHILPIQLESPNQTARIDTHWSWNQIKEPSGWKSRWKDEEEAGSSLSKLYISLYVCV